MAFLYFFLILKLTITKYVWYEEDERLEVNQLVLGLNQRHLERHMSSYRSRRLALYPLRDLPNHAKRFIIATSSTAIAHRKKSASRQTPVSVPRIQKIRVETAVTSRTEEAT